MNAAAALTVEELLGGEITSSAPPLWAEEVRALAPEDLLALAEPKGSRPSPLKKVRSIHHQIARLLAAGDRPTEVATATGYSISRISILQGDPLFQELLDFYRTQEDLRFAEMREQVEALGRAATEELLERVTSEAVDFISDGELRKIMESALDRSGHSPTKKVERLSVTLSKKELEELKGRVDARRTDRVVATVERDTGTGVGGADDGPAPRDDAEEAEGGAGEG